MTTSPLAVRTGAQTPRVSNYPAYSSSSGDEAVELAAAAGLHLDPWQQYVLRHGLGERPDGRWSAFKCACWVPRQNGKGGVIEARVLAGLFLFGERLMMWSAHEYKTAQEGFLRLRELIEGCPDLSRRVKAIREANGEQGVELKSGQRLRFVARSRGSGRGFSGDLNILDEAQYLTAAQMAALLPTMSARPNPQLWFFGTPPEDDTAWVYGVRADGEAADPRMAYFDWGADLDLSKPEDRARVTDRDLWYETNPALGIRIEEEFVEGELKPSGLGSEFAHERLGVWRPRALGGGVIGETEWSDAEDVDSQVADPVALSADVTPDRSHASIAIAGRRPDGLLHVELVDRRAGTGWVIPRLVELKTRWKPCAVVIDPIGPAGSLIASAEEAGLEVVKLSATDAKQAAGAFYDAVAGEDVEARVLRHLSQPDLNAAVLGAVKRPLGDAWAWDRRNAAVDISPLVAATNALWGYAAHHHLAKAAAPWAMYA